MMSVDSIASAGAYIKDGRLRVLATGGAKRSSLLPEVPTVSEAGAEVGLAGFELGSWYALFAPAGTPADVVRTLNGEVVRALGAPEIREQFAALGAEPVGSTPEQLAEVLQRDLVKWRKVARAANVPLQ
jgi:tripartite-type tricarboxylate transporter receptor subunit TctC